MMKSPAVVLFPVFAGFAAALFAGSEAPSALFVGGLGALGLLIARAMGGKEDRSFFLWLFALGFALRLIWSLVLLNVIPHVVHNQPYLSFGFLGDDGLLYDSQGQAGVQVWDLGHNPFDAYTTTAKGYIFLNTLVYKLMGHEVFAVRAVDSFLGALTPLFVFGIARSFLSQGYARLSAVLVAFYPDLVIYSGGHLKDVSIAAAFAAGLWATLKFLHARWNILLVPFVALLAFCELYLVSTRAYYGAVLPLALLLPVFGGRRFQVIRRGWSYKLPLAVMVLVLLWVVARFAIRELSAPNFLSVNSAFRDATNFYNGFVQPASETSFNSIIQPPFNIFFIPVGLLFTILNPFLLWPIVAPDPVFTILSPAIISWYVLLPFVLYGFVNVLQHPQGRALAVIVLAALAVLIFLGSGVQTTGRTKVPIEPLFLIFAAVGLKHLWEGRKTIRTVVFAYLSLLLVGIMIFLRAKEPELFRSFFYGVLPMLAVLLGWVLMRGRLREGFSIRRSAPR